MSTNTTLIQHSAGSFNQYKNARKGNEMHEDHKVINKTVFIFKGHSCQHSKISRTIQKNYSQT